MLDYNEYDEYKNLEHKIRREEEDFKLRNEYTEDDLEDWRQWAEEWVQKKKEG